VGPLIQVDRKEWKDFLESLSKLEEKYRLVLDELDTARSRLRALENSLESREEKLPTPTIGASVENQTIRATIEQGRTGPLAQLRTELRSLQTSAASPASGRHPTPEIYCSRCRCGVVHGTRFCELCGADFGMWVCSCGRELVESDRFCDNCGLPVEYAP